MNGAAIERVYVWQWPVRATHWVLFLSIVVLSATGYYLGNPFVIASGPANARFVMGLVRIVHDYAAIAFSLAVLARLAWMFLGNEFARWDQFLPVTRDRLKNLWGTLKFYLFLQRDPSPGAGHNALAGGAYVLVYTLCLVEIGTGLGLYGLSAHVGSPLRAFAFLATLAGGAQFARFLHHVVMWLLLGFFVHHLYSAIFVSWSEKNGALDSIFTGFKFLPRKRAGPTGAP